MLDRTGSVLVAPTENFVAAFAGDVDDRFCGRRGAVGAHRVDEAVARAAATLRNATPVGFVLPTGHRPVVHTVTLNEAQDFQPGELVVDREPDRREVLLKEVDDRLRVELVANPFGAPGRSRRPPAVWLEMGQWVRWQINYRFGGSWAGSWSYRLDTLNLAYGPTPAEVFTGTPSRYVDERAHLR